VPRNVEHRLYDTLVSHPLGDNLPVNHPFSGNGKVHVFFNRGLWPDSSASGNWCSRCKER
jgi:hypothetical protein